MTTLDTNATVERLLEDLRKAYLHEFPERCNDLETGVMQLDRGENFSQVFEELYRNVHSIKGGAGTHGFSVLSQICHQFEDLLTSVGPGGSRAGEAVIDTALKYVDLLRETASELVQHAVDTHRVQSILENLRQTDKSKQYKVLFVDASKVNRNICSNALSTLPVKITLEDNGLNALDRLLSEPFDILITSRELNGLNGIALTAAARYSETFNAGITAILLTSTMTIPPEIKKLCSYVIRKDHEMASELHRVIRQHLALHTTKAK